MFRTISTAFGIAVMAGAALLATYDSQTLNAQMSGLASPAVETVVLATPD